MTHTSSLTRRVMAGAAAAGLIATMSAAMPGAQSGPMNHLTDAERAEGWVLLFDGKTIDKWRGYRQQSVPDGWTVVDGTIARTGKGGDLITSDQFGDFELKIDFKVAPKGNSGIFYRGVESETGPIYHTAPEYQVLDDAGHPDAKNGPDRYCGGNYALDPPAAKACKAAGEWNSARIVAKGAHVEHWLNGQKVVEYELWSPEWKAKVAASKFKQWPGYGMAKRGHIAIQDHGDEVAFRNIKIRTIKPDKSE